MLGDRQRHCDHTHASERGVAPSGGLDHPHGGRELGHRRGGEREEGHEYMYRHHGLAATVQREAALALTGLLAVPAWPVRAADYMTTVHIYMYH